MPVSVTYPEGGGIPYTLNIDHTTTPYTVRILYQYGPIRIKTMTMDEWVKNGCFYSSIVSLKNGTRITMPNICEIRTIVP